MTRGERTDGHKEDGPERKCIASGESFPAAKLLRFVISPDGMVVPDLAGKLPGRGIWITPERALIEQAAKKNLFARAAKQPVTVPDDLADLLERLLVKRVIELISLARKGGEAVSGYERVKDWLIKDEAETLIQASDGSERGKSKLSTPYEGFFIGWLTADELGQAFGRETTIHAALRYGGLGQRVVEEAAKLKGLRVSGGDAARKGK